MKKIKFDGKLNLNKKTVSRLNQEQLDGVIGGKLTDHACRTGKFCARTTTETYCSVSIACVDIDNLVHHTTGAGATRTITIGVTTGG